MPPLRSPARRAAALVATVLAIATGCTTLRVAAGRMALWGWRPDPAVAHRDTAFTSGGATVLVERFAPRDLPATGAAHLPAVLVLHPSDGVRGRGGVAVRQWADAFARSGRVAYVVHYFDRTGDRATDDAREDAVFPEWTAALRDAVTFVRHDPAVDSTRVDAFGFSLGGYMALALGAADARVRRLVVLSGGFFDTLAPTVRRLPPTLLLHGDADDVVPVRQATRVVQTLRRLGVPHALVVYPGQGHGLDAASTPDGVQRAVGFLDAADPATAATIAVR